VEGTREGAWRSLTQFFEGCDKWSCAAWRGKGVTRGDWIGRRGFRSASSDDATGFVQGGFFLLI
jgi:hypothetical protein